MLSDTIPKCRLPVLPNKYDISEFFPDLVFKTIIPRNTRLAEAPSHGLPVNYYDKSSKGSKSFDMLALEVIDRG